MTAPVFLEFDEAAASRVVAAACGLAERSVRGVIALLLEGHTVPFMARYRKERTGGLDEREIASVQDALQAHRDLVDRKNTVLRTIAEQGLLDDELRGRIVAAPDRRTVEDLYLPFKPKRRTRAQIAREQGLEPLADLLESERDPAVPPAEALARWIDPARGVADAAAALKGAGDILAERWAERVAVRQWLRDEVGRGSLRAKKKRGYDGEDRRFETYYDFSEPLARVASHRVLALRRGAAEGALSIGIEVDREHLAGVLRRRLLRRPDFVFHRELAAAVDDCLARLLLPSIQGEIQRELEAAADRAAIDVFARNLEELLLAAPAGPRVIVGLDPGFRSGCKVAVVDTTGRVLEHTTFYPTPPRSDVVGASRVLRDLIRRHGAELIAVGNGTGSRETEAFVTEALGPDSPVARVTVSEAGASVYSASEVARAELPGLDVSIRGAVSIARRLQDPLAELVKIDPKSIGVGQYQHDVDQAELKRALARVVESAVNRVGVDVNMASPSLLAHVAGIGPRLADSIVSWRDENGRFSSRRELMRVPRFGAKAFEQSAGFLRVRGGAEALDASAVHPESYDVVARMAAFVDMPRGDLVGSDAVRRLEPERFVSADAGLPTIRDIIAELEKPGRDPRTAFQLARFDDAVREVRDLEIGMILEGVVTNVTHFGAFVDVGVHQDGLVHVSQLADRFVSDPTAVVRVGEIVRVRVLDVDRERGRISLSRREIEG